MSTKTNKIVLNDEQRSLAVIKRATKLYGQLTQACEELCQLAIETEIVEKALSSNVHLDRIANHHGEAEEIRTSIRDTTIQESLGVAYGRSGQAGQPVELALDKSLSLTRPAYLLTTDDRDNFQLLERNRLPPDAGWVAIHAFHEFECYNGLLDQCQSVLKAAAALADMEVSDEIDQAAKCLPGNRGNIFKFIARRKYGVSFGELKSARDTAGNDLTTSRSDGAIASMLRRINGNLQGKGWRIDSSPAKDIITARKLTEAESKEIPEV